MLRVGADRVSFGFSSEFITSAGVRDDDAKYYYDGGIGHISGFFIDVSNY